MARTESNMLPLGTAAPEFSLPDTVSGENVSLTGLDKGEGLVIYFICNHCPFVIHVNEELVRIARDYQSKGIQFVAISSNDVENYPQDDPKLMKIHAEKSGYSFPYLYDETQEVAKAYQAACTPDIYVFDSNRKLVYRGQIDGSRPGNEVPITGVDLRTALDALLSGEPISPIQRPSVGCNIKWKNQ